MVSDAYARAQAGGPHEGLLRTYRDKPASMINKAIGSLVKKIAIHEQKIAHPDAFLRPNVDEREKRHLVDSKWPTEILIFRAEIEVLQGLLREREHG